MISRKSLIFGLILIAVGLVLILDQLDIIWFDFEDFLRVIFPTALIILGLWLILRKKRPRGDIHVSVVGDDGSTHKASFSGSTHSASFSTSTAPPPPPPPSGAEASASASSSFADADSATDDAPKSESADSQGPRLSQQPEFTNDTGGNKIRYSKSLGDMFVNFDGVNLTNVEISMGVGDLEAKLTGGVLSQGLNRLVVSGFVGDIRVFVPRDMAYQVHCSNTIGDIDLAGRHASGFGNNVEGQSDNYGQADSKLYIAVNSFIGDIRVYEL